MSRIVFLLEEYSAKALLEELLPRLFPDLRFLCVSHEGKRDLEKSIPRKLRAWREPGDRFCILRDNDGADCRDLKRSLVEMCRTAGRPDTLVRIACQEMEAWYFGAPGLLAQGFRDERLRSLDRKARFRVPDAIARPAKELHRLVPAFQKVSGARTMGGLLERENSSASFRVLLSGIARLEAEMRATGGGAT